MLPFKMQRQKQLIDLQEGLQSPIWRPPVPPQGRGCASSLLSESASKGGEIEENRRRYTRTRCLVQGHLVIFWDPQDTWMSYGTILNAGPGGILFGFSKNFHQDAKNFYRTGVLVKFILDASTGKEKEIQGYIVHISFKEKTYIGISFLQTESDLISLF